MCPLGRVVPAALSVEWQFLLSCVWTQRRGMAGERSSSVHEARPAWRSVAGPVHGPAILHCCVQGREGAGT